VISSQANGLYTSAELGYSGDNYAMVRARALVPKEWEQFTLCRDASTNNFYFVSQANLLVVSAELDYVRGNYAMLRARTAINAIGPWEQLYIQRNDDGTVSIQSLANLSWVSVELDYYADHNAELRARAGLIGPWEKFNYY
jgi:hypothetical protein